MCFYDTLKSTSQFGKTPSSDKDRMIHTNRPLRRDRVHAVISGPLLFVNVVINFKCESPFISDPLLCESMRT